MRFSLLFVVLFALVCVVLAQEEESQEAGGWFSKTKDWVSGAAQSTKDWFTDASDTVGNWVNGVWQKTKDWVSPAKPENEEPVPQ